MNPQEETFNGETSVGVLIDMIEAGSELFTDLEKDLALKSFERKAVPSPPVHKTKARNAVDVL